MALKDVSRRLAQEVSRLDLGPPVAYVYNPLVYARGPHEVYLDRWGRGSKEVLLLGMNLGPFGMAQTGVPFGEVSLAREWLGIEAKVSKPAREQPKRPVLGFDCTRSEVSGARLWGWARDRFGEPERFFERHLVVNYCPLVFLAESGRSITPDKLRKAEREALFEPCDRALRRTLEITGARAIVGIGRFAEIRAAAALEGLDVPVLRMLHPSPANPAANRGWAEAADAALASAGTAPRP